MNDETRQALERIERRIQAEWDHERDAPLHRPTEYVANSAALDAFRIALHIVREERLALDSALGNDREAQRD